MRIYRGDLTPDLEITCTNRVYNPATGRHDQTTPVDLTAATTVKVIGVRDGVEVFNRPVNDDAPDGVVTMPWQPGDTDTPGQIVVEVEVTWPGGKLQTFRPQDYVTVAPDLG